MKYQELITEAVETFQISRSILHTAHAHNVKPDTSMLDVISEICGELSNARRDDAIGRDEYNALRNVRDDLTLVYAQLNRGIQSLQHGDYAIDKFSIANA